MKSRYFQLFLVILAAGSIFPLVYLRNAYQETMTEVFAISYAQLNNIYVALGIAGSVGYIPSGWLADRFSTKKLIFISLLMCGGAGIMLAQIPSYSMVVFIYIIIGIGSVLTFWSSHMKIVKLLAPKAEEARFFGMLDGGRGLIEAILATVALFIFTTFLTRTDSTTPALQGVIYMYSIFILLVGFLVLIFVKEPSNSANTEPAEKVPLNKETILQVLGNKYVLLLGLIIFLAYIVVWTLRYQSGFLQSVVNIDVVRVVQVMVVALWMRPIGGVLGGFLADKFGKDKILIIALSIAVGGLVALAIIPIVMPNLIFESLVVLIHLMVYAVRGTYWSLLGECNVDEQVLGKSIGLISFIGYIPDVLVPMISTWLLLGFGETTGQSAFFIFGAIMGFLSIFVIVIFRRKVIKRDGI
ncbi:MAG: MFS transporter [Firmicutes bacterium]|nr:MFS transporter [Bacillota bacterium]